jgi:hypothetical protein
MPLLDFPKDMYELRPGEKPMYGEFPDLKKCVQWFKGLMSADDWVKRRDAVAKRFYQSLVGELDDPSCVGRIFDDRDMFGWYLFLGEAFTDHPWNYEVVFGSRVVPVFAAIGRNLTLLLQIDGFTERACRLIGSEKSQPNGALFEMLVAAAYARAGARVTFPPELPGQARTYDLDVELNGDGWAVECKRMETGDYVEMERARMRTLWVPASRALVDTQRSSLLNVDFKIELSDVCDNYLFEKANTFAKSKRASLSWEDSTSAGIIYELDMRPIQDALSLNLWLYPSPQFDEKLTGSYHRYQSSLALLKVKPAKNPHFIDELDLAVVARWKCLSDVAIEKRARQILAKLVEADNQLPSDKSGVIHIGFESLGDDAVEQRRYEKIIATAGSFKSRKELRYIYCHYFAPEASPTETWAFDETVQWLGIKPTGKPLDTGMLVAPDDQAGRPGVHWIRH